MTTNKIHSLVPDDLGNLWGRFFEEQIGTRIAEKGSGDIYVIFTDYESDYTGNYTCLMDIMWIV